jgi:hypothetical protein
LVLTQDFALSTLKNVNFLIIALEI